MMYLNRYAAGQDMQYFEKYFLKNALDQLENLHEKTSQWQETDQDWHYVHFDCPWFFFNNAGLVLRMRFYF